MKKFVISLALALCVLTGYATIKHPSLLFTPSKVEHARRLIACDSVQAEAWAHIESVANELLNCDDIRRMEYLALAYQMTGDRCYSDKLRSMLLDISEIESWSDTEMMQRTPPWRSELQMAHKAYQIAVAYDAVYNDLSKSERCKIAEGVYRLAVDPLLGDWFLEPTRIHSLNSMGHNWWTSCIGMGGLLALAISNEIPQAYDASRSVVAAFPEWFDFAGDAIQGKAKNFDEGGGMYESINYASFGITEALLLRLAWLNSHPGTELEELPQMSKLPEFFASVAYPRDGMLFSVNFGDSHKNVSGESSLILAYEMGVKNPVILWYLNQIEPGQHREGYPRHVPMGFLYSPSVKDAPVIPGLSESKVWNDFGWATIRDSWEKNATMLAVKSGTTWNHSHADANSLILFHKGVDIIKDSGNSSYGTPQYRNYFFQSDAHNVVKFDGEGQLRYQQYHGTLLAGSLHYLLDGNGVRFVLADGTGPMSHSLDRNLRSFLWIDNVIYVVDDIHSHRPGKFEWLWHPGGRSRKVYGDIEVVNGNSSVIIRPLYPEPLAPSNFVHDYPDMLYWEEIEVPDETLQSTEKYWSLHLPAVTDRVKGVTAIILKDSVNQKAIPEIVRTEGRNWIGLKISDGDKVTDLYINQLADGRLMHLNSWINAEGWETDAYMLAITYKKEGSETKPERIFINYGSALRRDGEVYFSSLSKLNAVYNPASRDMRVNVNGQNRMNLKIKASPSRMTVNGNPYKLDFHDGLVSIKLHNKN